MTQQYRSHHREILGLLSEIESHFHIASLQLNAAPIRRLCTRLSGKLKYHLAVKQGALYPRLLVHGNDTVRMLADRCARDLDPLRHSFESFMRAWVHSDHIGENPREFIASARSLFAGIREQLEIEGGQLYALVEDQRASPRTTNPAQ